MTTQNIVKQEEYDDKKLALIKNTVAKGATNEELALFIYQARRTGLDPLTRQIYFIKGNDGRVLIMSSIDGFRIVAQRSGKYAGQDEPIWTLDKDGHLEKCSVTVHQFGRNGQRFPTTATAYFKEYVKPGFNGRLSMWDKMPHAMIAKVAESLALRKAFPQDLSGIYSSEEIEEQKETPVTSEKEIKTEPMPVKLVDKPAQEITVEIDTPLSDAVKPITGAGKAMLNGMKGTK